jgi:dihydroorotate dehydrogenase (fumarate)
MDLTTKYLGMTLKHPLVPSASPLSETLDGIRRMEDAGAAAIVMYSLFEEQINAESHHLDHYLSYGTDTFAEALNYFPDMDTFKAGPDEYLNLINRAKQSTDMPIIGSINGVSSGGWIEYATRIEEAGADALELNIYYIPTDIGLPGAEIEQMYVDVVHDIKQTVSIPIAVKVSPYFSSTANMAAKLVEAGADGLVLFNRFYQPDFDLDELEVVPKVSLSSPATPHALRLPLRWIAILYGQLQTDFALTSGVHSHLDVLKGLMAGANVTMLASEILRNGVGRLDEIRKDMELWMEEHEYESVEQMQGSMSQKNVAEPAAFERANYMRVLHSWRPDPTGVNT